MEIYLIYQLLAGLFEYPSIKLIDKVVECQNMLERNNPNASRVLGRFLNLLFDTPMIQIEESYVRSFHLQILPQLNLLYDEYQNGRLILKTQNNNVCLFENGSPRDYTNLVADMTSWHETRDIHETTTELIIPSLYMILDGFKTSKAFGDPPDENQRNSGSEKSSHYSENMYRYAFQALLMVFEKEFRGECDEWEVPSCFKVNPLITTRTAQHRHLGFDKLWVCRN